MCTLRAVASRRDRAGRTPFDSRHLREVWEVRALLERGDELIERFQLTERDAPPIMALLALGMERLGKLTYGIATGNATMRWTHNLVDLDRECRRLMRDQARTSFVVDLLDDLDRDPFLDDLLVALDEYANGGRYYFQDLIRGDPAKYGRSPYERWTALIGSVLRLRPDLTSVYDLNDPNEVPRREREQNEELRRTLFRWRRTYYYAWMNGACGETARALGGEITPTLNRPLPNGFDTDRDMPSSPLPP